MTYRQPVRLEKHHNLAEFECRSEEQTTWLRKSARQANAVGTTTVFVVTPDDSPSTVAAYYAWCMAAVSPANAPKRLAQGGGQYPQPVALLARLGVDFRHERQGLGAGMMQDVFARLVSLREEIGCGGLLVHCENAEAMRFYLHLVKEFEQSPTDPLHLYLLMKDVRKALGT
jgi:ribosomal protein S18 acetylase RimI-like enzyme